MYITRKDALNILQNMQLFELSLKEVFDEFEYGFHDNLGRRNILLSNSQEKETAKILGRKFRHVISDGATGQPDVVIKDIGKELECKLTSGSKSRETGNVTYSFYTDWASINKKKCLDYNYIVANPDFTKFCYIIFEGLTPDDFFVPHKSARGKAQMNKSKAFKKAVCLVGGIVDKSLDYIADVEKEIEQREIQKAERIAELNKRLDECSEQAVKKREDILRILENETARHDKALSKLHKKLYERRKKWADKGCYTFEFEEVPRMLPELTFWQKAVDLIKGFWENIKVRSFQQVAE